MKKMTQQKTILQGFAISCIQWSVINQEEHIPMAKTPMGTLQLSCIQIAIVLLLFTGAKSTTEERFSHQNGTVGCIGGERSALLAFRAGLSDPTNLLSPWNGDDCCRWKGVYCGNRTGHVFMLDLRATDCQIGRGRLEVLAGNISSSLLALQHLSYLDLSCNRFDKIQIPEFMGSLHKLRYLDLSMTHFIGRLPPQLGNLSNLQYLSLHNSNPIYTGTYSTDITWLSQLTSLEYLDMSSVNLSTIVHWLPVVNMLPTLEVLYLSFCQLRSSPDFLPHSNLSSLETLSLSGNEFNKHSTPNWFWHLPSIKYLDISFNGFYGPFPDEIGKMTSIVELGLSEQYHRNKLQKLLLGGNNLTGSLPTTLVEPLSNLALLDLSDNKLIGHVPLWIGELTKLTTLILSSNNLDGVMHEGHFSGLDMLEVLSLSDNSIAIAFGGPIPKLPINLTDLDLSRNNVVGPLPLDFGAPGLITLLLYNNMISGTIPSSLWKLRSLQLLDLSRNHLNGSIMDCLVNESSTDMTDLSIIILSLRNNNLSGEFPSLLQRCPQLIFLDLGHNQFSGTLPPWIGEKLLSLSFLRLRSNMFYGHIPIDLTELVDLQYLDLANNNMSGSIPRSIVNCTRMTQTRDHYYDVLHYVFTSATRIGDNELVHYTGNLTVLTKGQERLYTGEIINMVNLDLSCNSLTGVIPAELSALVALKSLNLSWNNFNGKIPENVSALMQVESLDLSHNDLSGEIPSSLSALTSLSRLNLSYNNLSGKIPTGNQLQTLEDPASIYIGNPGLCGPPLSRKCSSQHEPILGDNHEAARYDDLVSFFLAMGSGYVMGLWVVFVTLLFKRKWRASWYSMYDRAYVQVAVTWASLRGKMR
uniref:Uncharacterized protein n=1 Tax=Avena sativa TaxID=4498 RepID=A0ACD5TBG2_AVESA